MLPRKSRRSPQLQWLRRLRLCRLRCLRLCQLAAALPPPNLVRTHEDTMCTPKGCLLLAHH